MTLNCRERLVWGFLLSYRPDFYAVLLCYFRAIQKKQWSVCKGKLSTSLLKQIICLFKHYLIDQGANYLFIVRNYL